MQDLAAAINREFTNSREYLLDDADKEVQLIADCPTYERQMKTF